MVLGVRTFPGADRAVFSKRGKARETAAEARGGAVAGPAGGERERGQAALSFSARAAGARGRDRRAGAAAAGLHLGAEHAEGARCTHRHRLLEKHAGDGCRAEPARAGEAGGAGSHRPAPGRPGGADRVCGQRVFAGADDGGLWRGAELARGTRHGHHPARRHGHRGGDQDGGRGFWQRRERQPRADHFHRRRGAGRGRRESRRRAGRRGAHLHGRARLGGRLADSGAGRERRNGFCEGRERADREIAAR